MFPFDQIKHFIANDLEEACRQSVHNNANTNNITSKIFYN